MSSDASARNDFSFGPSPGFAARVPASLRSGRTPPGEPAGLGAEPERHVDRPLVRDDVPLRREQLAQLLEPERLDPSLPREGELLRERVGGREEGRAPGPLEGSAGREHGRLAAREGGPGREVLDGPLYRVEPEPRLLRLARVDPEDLPAAHLDAVGEERRELRELLPDRGRLLHLLARREGPPPRDLLAGDARPRDLRRLFRVARLHEVQLRLVEVDARDEVAAKGLTPVDAEPDPARLEERERLPAAGPLLDAELPDLVGEVADAHRDVREPRVHPLQPGEGAPRPPGGVGVEREPRSREHEHEADEDVDGTASADAHGSPRLKLILRRSGACGRRERPQACPAAAPGGRRALRRGCSAPPSGAVRGRVHCDGGGWSRIQRGHAREA